MGNKKIAILIDSLRGGGAERVCTTVASGLAESGWNVNLIVVNMHHAAYFNDLSDKVFLIDLKSKQIYSAFKIYKVFKKNKIDRVLVFNHQLAVIVILLNKFFNLNVEVIARNINTLSRITDLDYRNKPFKKWLVNKYYKKADFFVNQCDAMEEDLLSLYPELQGMTTVIYNPVAHVIERYVDENDIAKIQKENFLLCVGRLSKQKAIHLAIECFSKLHEEHPGLRLKIIGQGKLEEKLKELTIDFKVADKVDFEGFKKNIIPYYLKAKAVLLTSEFEGFPNVLVESITLGTPVVSFDIQSGPSEIIQDGVNGYLVKKRSVDELYEKINLVLQQNFDRKQISKTVKFTKSKQVIKKWSEFLER